MKVPESWPLPSKDRLQARAQVGYCGAAWLIYNHAGKIITQYANPFQAAQHVNRHNLLREQFS